MATTNCRVGTAFAEFDLWAVHNLGERTRKGYRKPLELLRKVIDEVGIERIAHVEHKHLLLALERCSATAKRGDNMANTQNGYISAYRSLFAYLVKHRHVGKSKNPAALLQFKEESPRKMLIVPESRWIEAVEQGFGIHARDGVIMSMLFHLGMRREEIAHIRIGDLDEDLKRISFARSKLKDRKPMAIADTLRKHLEDWFAWLRWHHGKTNSEWYLFPARVRLGRGNLMFPDWPVDPTTPVHIETISRLVKTVMLALGYTPAQLRQQAVHITRRSAGVAYQRRYKDIRKTAQFLGHKNIEVTERYLRYGDDEEEFEEDVRGLGEIFAPRIEDCLSASHSEATQALMSPVPMSPLELIAQTAKATADLPIEQVMMMLKLGRDQLALTA